MALASAPGASSRAVLRMSGPRSLQALASLVGSRSAAEDILGSSGFRRWTGDLLPAGIPLPVVALLYRAPRSYTREDMVEVVAPGAPAVADLLLRALLAWAPSSGGGLRMAHAGEFTLRAFLSGRVDLSQAEAVQALIASHSETEERAARRQLDGELRTRLAALESRLVEALALIEASIDFPDEDLPSVSSAVLAARLSGLVDDIDAVLSASALRVPPRGAVRAVIAGLPNAGKSSLLNALLGRDAAIVSAEAGSTRDPVGGRSRTPTGEWIEWLDLAGMERVPRDAQGDVSSGDVALGIDRLNREAIETADVLVWAVDGADLDTRDRSLGLFRELSLGQMARILVVTKRDLLSPGAVRKWEELSLAVLFVSAFDRAGLDALLSRVVGRSAQGEAPQYLFTARQDGALRRARQAVVRARSVIERGEGVELGSVDLREAQEFLGHVTGREVGERVLDAIFREFCIGK